MPVLPWGVKPGSGGGGTGNVVGPGISTTNAIAIYANTSGTLLNNSAVTITGGSMNVLNATTVNAAIVNVTDIGDGSNTIVGIVGNGGTRFVNIANTVT